MLRLEREDAEPLYAITVLGRRKDRVMKFMSTSMPAPFDVAGDGEGAVWGGAARARMSEFYGNQIMAGTRLRQFNRQLKQIATPRLGEYGFEPFPGRIFRRCVKHDGVTTTQIIDFQVGLQRFAGRFTVNLGVYNPDLMPQSYPRADGQLECFHCLSDLTQRLGFFYDPPQTKMEKLLRRPKPARHDYWWEQSEKESQMIETMEAACECLIQHGINWLDSRTSKKAFKWAEDELQRRKALKAKGLNAFARYERLPFPSGL